MESANADIGRGIVKEPVWNLLINKEEGRSSVVKKHLKTVTEHYQRISEKISYVNELLEEYAVNAVDVSMEARAYQLQLYRVREKLEKEAELLSISMKETQDKLTGHYREIQKFNKLRDRAILLKKSFDERMENRQQDEASVMRFNFNRRPII